MSLTEPNETIGNGQKIIFCICHFHQNIWASLELHQKHLHRFRRSWKSTIPIPKIHLIWYKVTGISFPLKQSFQISGNVGASRDKGRCLAVETGEWFVLHYVGETLRGTMMLGAGSWITLSDQAGRWSTQQGPSGQLGLQSPAAVCILRADETAMTTYNWPGGEG